MGGKPGSSDSLNDMPFRELAHRAETAESRNLLNDLSFRESRGLLLSIRCFPRSFGRNCYVVKISKIGQSCGKDWTGGELPYRGA